MAALPWFMVCRMPTPSSLLFCVFQFDLSRSWPRMLQTLANPRPLTSCTAFSQQRSSELNFRNGVNTGFCSTLMIVDSSKITKRRAAGLPVAEILARGSKYFPLHHTLPTPFPPVLRDHPPNISANCIGCWPTDIECKPTDVGHRPTHFSCRLANVVDRLPIISY